jgi:hypothetical protein
MQGSYDERDHRQHVETTPQPASGGHATQLELIAAPEPRTVGARRRPYEEAGQAHKPSLKAGPANALRLSAVCSAAQDGVRLNMPAAWSCLGMSEMDAAGRDKRTV